MNRIKLTFLLCSIFVIIGCASTKEALDRYEACKGDPVCISEMEKVKSVSFSVTKGAVTPFVPSSPAELIALGVSNLLSFAFGVWKGKKKG